MKVTTIYGAYNNIVKIELIELQILMLYYDNGDTQAIATTDLINIMME